MRVNISIFCFFLNLVVFVFAIWKSGGPIDFLENWDTMFFIGLGTVTFSGLFCLLQIQDENHPVFFSFLSLPLSLIILLSVTRNIEGTGEILGYYPSPKYPVVLTQSSNGAVVVRLLSVKNENMLFSKHISSGDLIYIVVPASQKFQTGEHIRFRAFLADAPIIGGFPYLEAKSSLSFIENTSQP